MAIALVQQQQATTGGSPAATLSFTLGAAPTNGNMLICAAENNDDATGPSIATTGVTWTRKPYFRGDASHDNIVLWTGVVGAGASATTTITWHNTGDANNAAILVEFSGVQQVVDGTPPTPTDVSSATPSVTSNTPSVAGDLVVAFCGQASAIAPTATPAGWTALTAATNSRRIDGAYFVNTGSGTVTPQWTYATSKFALLEIVLIKATGGGGTAWSQPLSDTITLSDAVVKSPTAKKADTVTLSDAFARTAVFGRSFADTITLSDAAAKSLGLTKADTITTSDALSKSLGLTKTDSVTLSDAIAKTIGLTKSDSYTITDALAKSLAHKLADTITLSDFMSSGGAPVNYTLNLTDTITLADAFTRTLSNSGASPATAGAARTIFLRRFGIY